MPPITQEQQNHLEGFTEKRDALVQEVSDLTRDRDSLSKNNNELTTANSILVGEIAANELKVQESNKATSEELARHQASLKEAKADVEDAKAQKDELMKDIASVAETLASVTKSVDELAMFVLAVTQGLKDLKDEVKSGVDGVIAGANEVRRVTGAMQNIVTEFHNSLVAGQVENEKRRVELDVRESSLVAREGAINDTYAEVLKVMKESKTQLSDLKPASAKK